MINLLDDYDWACAFEYAGEKSDDGWTHGEANIVSAHPLLAYDLAPFTREDVESVSGHVEGAKDEEDWVIYGKLKDGRWFSIEAWCDYTGWDCQAGGSTTIAHSEDEIVSMGLTEGARKRLGINSPAA